MDPFDALNESVLFPYVDQDDDLNIHDHDYDDYDDDDYEDREPDEYDVPDNVADAETLASVGWGTDEDYGYYGDDW